MNVESLQRKARELLEVDSLLGADAIPLGALPEAVTASADPPAPPSRAVSAEQAPPNRPAAGSGTGRPPARKPVPAPRPGAAKATSSPLPTPAEVTTPLPPAGDTDATVEALEALRAELHAWVEAHWPRDGWANVVFGEGDPAAKIMFVGEGPGADEDRLGRPFVGRAGKQLDKQIAAIGLSREQVYIANIARTRPPGNRVPTPDEAAAWMPWLVRQISILRPEVIVALGATSARQLLDDPKLAITRERGKWREWNGIAVMPTLHPAYLLRQYTLENRRKVWEDLKLVMARVGLKPS